MAARLTGHAVQLPTSRPDKAARLQVKLVRPLALLLAAVAPSALVAPSCVETGRVVGPGALAVGPRPPVAPALRRSAVRAHGSTAKLEALRRPAVRSLRAVGSPVAAGRLAAVLAALLALSPRFAVPK